MRLRAIAKLNLMIIGLLSVFLFTACTENEKLSMDVPEGFAESTLKEFARQAEVEIIFDPKSLHDVKTNAAKGEYEPQSALRVMLKDTPLSFVYDEESGAYAIIRSEANVGDDVFLFAHFLASASFKPFLPKTN